MADPKIRHSRDFLRFFAFDHLPPALRAASSPVYFLASKMVEDLPEGPEKSAGLRKLLEAKDCFVRAALDTED